MKRVIKWIGITAGGLIGLALVAACTLFVVGGSKLQATNVIAAEPGLVIPSDSASIARGAHLVQSRPCGACHGADLGGMLMADVQPFARIVAPNLTRGRGGRTPPLTDDEWERAIRHGVRREGTSLIVMPSEEFHGVADNEIAPMIAYLKQMPPVDRDVPAFLVRPAGRIMLGAGVFKTAARMTPRTPHVAMVDTTPSLAYGQYLVSTNGCRGCHGQALSGGPGDDPSSPPASNLTPAGIGHYSEEDFRNILRTGMRPSGGAQLKNMPWQFYGKMTDGELHSIWLFLKALPSKQFAEQ